jgi:hypothetical protein
VIERAGMEGEALGAVVIGERQRRVRHGFVARLRQRLARQRWLGVAPRPGLHGAALLDLRAAAVGARDLPLDLAVLCRRARCGGGCSSLGGPAVLAFASDNRRVPSVFRGGSG